MRTIADRAGISVGALYKYYGDKDGFFRACLDRSLQALHRTMEEVTAEEAPAEVEEATAEAEAVIAFESLCRASRGIWPLMARIYLRRCE